jgi:hypothetical protein
MNKIKDIPEGSKVIILGFGAGDSRKGVETSYVGRLAIGELVNLPKEISIDGHIFNLQVKVLVINED